MAKKVAGCLIEPEILSTHPPQISWVVSALGLNILEKPSQLAQATSLSQENISLDQEKFLDIL